MNFARALFDPAMFGNEQVVAAFEASAVIAALCAIIGYFVVLRGLTFAGHALTDVGLSGGAGAVLIGIAPLWGLMAFAIVAALGIEALGSRVKERDVATGVVLTFALGLGALFLQLATQAANARSALLFGSIFEIDSGTIVALLTLGLATLLVLLLIARPLLFASVSVETATLRGVPVRALSIVFLIAMAVGVSEAAQGAGVLIATALLIGPAATAMTLSARPLRAIGLAALIGIAEAWLAVVLAYDSYHWPPGERGYPYGFFVAVEVLAVYVFAQAFASGRARGRRA